MRALAVEEARYIAHPEVMELTAEQIKEVSGGWGWAIQIGISIATSVIGTWIAEALSGSGSGGGSGGGSIPLPNGVLTYSCPPGGGEMHIELHTDDYDLYVQCGGT